MIQKYRKSIQVFELEKEEAKQSMSQQILEKNHLQANNLKLQKQL